MCHKGNLLGGHYIGYVRQVKSYMPMFVTLLPDSVQCIQTLMPSHYGLRALVLLRVLWFAVYRCEEHWYQFDDARVTLVTEETVRLSHAYMLFYLQQ